MTTTVFTVFFVVVIFAALGGFLVWLRRRYDAGSAAGAGSWLGSLRDELTGWRDRPAGPGPAARNAAPPAAPLPAPPRSAPATPAAARNGNGNGPRGAPPVQVAQSDLLHAMTALVAMASSGDIQVVRRVIKTLSAASDGLGGALTRLGTRLAEPDKHYGPEIWEPLVTAGAQVRAAGLHCAQSDAMTASLLAHTVEELAASSRQAPHHSQLNGGT